jgi:hypothetical protein
VTHNTTHAGTVGWLTLAVAVLVWDKRAEESLSHAFSRAPKPLTAVIWGITTAHLFGILPHQVDPFYRYVERR